MVQCSGGSRLLFEALQAIAVSGEGRGQHLDRDIASKTGIARAIDLSHAPGTERSDDSVRSEADTRSQAIVGGKAADYTLHGSEVMCVDDSRGADLEAARHRWHQIDRAAAPSGDVAALSSEGKLRPPLVGPPGRFAAPPSGRRATCRPRT